MIEWPILSEVLSFRVYKAPSRRRRSRGRTRETTDVSFPFRRVVLSQSDMTTLKGMIDEAALNGDDDGDAANGKEFGGDGTSVTWQNCGQMARLVGLEWDGDACDGLGEVVFKYVTHTWPRICNHDTQILKSKILADLKDEYRYIPEQVVALATRAVEWRSNVSAIYHQYQAAMHMRRCVTFARKAPDMLTCVVGALANLAPAGFAAYVVRSFPQLPDNVARKTGHEHFATYVCMLYFRLRVFRGSCKTVEGCMDTTTDNLTRTTGIVWEHFRDLERLFSAALLYADHIRRNIVQCEKLRFDAKNRRLAHKRKVDYLEQETTAVGVNDLKGDLGEWLEASGMRDIRAILCANPLTGHKHDRHGPLWEPLKQIVWQYVSLSCTTWNAQRGLCFVAQAPIHAGFRGHSKEHRNKVYYKKSKQGN